VLQCVADCCGVLQCTAALVVVQEHKDDEESASAGVLRCVIMCCCVLQCDAVCCSAGCGAGAQGRGTSRA